MESQIIKRVVFILDHNLMHYRMPLFDFLQRRGYEILVIHSGNEIKNSCFKQLIVKEYKFGPLFFKKLPILKHFDVVIQMQNIRYINTWLLSFNLIKTKNLIDWTIGTSTSKGLSKKIGLLDKCRNFLSNFSNATILYSDFARFKFSVKNQQKIFIANNTVYNPSAENLSCEDKDGFLFIGSLNRRKGIDLLLESFKTYISTIKDPTIKYLYIIGKGEMLNMVREYAKLNNLEDHIIILGEVNDPIIKKAYFRKSIINISPNQAGLSVLESFSFGVPFITKENAISGGEHLNIKNGYNGFLLRNDEDLLQMMKFTNKKIEEVKNMGHNAYEYYVKERDFKLMVNTFSQAIEFALGK